MALSHTAILLSSEFSEMSAFSILYASTVQRVQQVDALRLKLEVSKDDLESQPFYCPSVCLLKGAGLLQVIGG